MSYVFKISKAASDAFTAALKDLLFYSEHSTLKIKTDRKDTVAASTTAFFAHGRSYKPMFMCFAKDGSGRWYPVDGHTMASVRADIDGTNLNLHNTAGSSRDVRSFVMIDKLTD